MYKARYDNVNIFLDNIDNWLNDDKDNAIIGVGDINMDTRKPNLQTNKYPDDLAQAGLKSMIYEFKREETSGGKLTQQCKDHMYVQTRKGKFRGQVISEKVAEHYFVAALLRICFDTRPKNIDCSFINNSKVDRDIEGIGWNEVAKVQNAGKLFDSFVSIFQDIYAK